MNIDIYNSNSEISESKKDDIVSFLYHHLGQYGDTKSAISKAIEYSMGQNGGLGGFVVVANKDGKILGVTVINKTGMEEYIPSNILVYIATHEEHRGEGIGKALMNAAIEKCKGGIALHVEPDNPARYLYEKLGFTNKYLEMRLTS